MSTTYGKRMHAPTPSLLPHVCGTCHSRDSDPTWHRQPVATVSPRRDGGGHIVPPALREQFGLPPMEDVHRAVARRTDPSTSWEAARSVSRLTAKQRAVMAVYRLYGSMTDEETAARYWGPEQSPSGLRTRRSELVKAGLLRWTGETKIGSTGRKMRVWGVAS